jgi:hypothetical protein
MTSIYFANLSSDEMCRLRHLGVVEDSEGLSISDEELWEWLDPSGRAFPIAERVDLLTFSTASGLSEDEWQFCRIKFKGSNEYVYLSDASFCADSYVIGGMSLTNPLISIQSYLAAIRPHPVKHRRGHVVGSEYAQGVAFGGSSGFHWRAVWA